jgi:glycerophosphoryl diester phosphodiesterase
LGAEWVEIDVQRVEDQLLVIHDERVGRTTNGCGKLQKLGIKTIRAPDAGQREKIPFLSEVLETVHGRVGLNIELKGRGTADPVFQMIQDFGD